MKRNKRLTLIAALLLCLTVTVGITAAYFTDYESGKGGASVDLSGQTRLKEDMDGNNKIISIVNTGETDMIVRVMIYGDEKRMTVTPGEGWIKGDDGAYYYNRILKAGKDGAEGESTSEIVAEIAAKEGEDPEDFDILVVHESSRVVYDGQGDPDDKAQKLAAPEGWDKKAVAKIDTAAE